MEILWLSPRCWRVSNSYLKLCSSVFRGSFSLIQSYCSSSDDLICRFSYEKWRSGCSEGAIFKMMSLTSFHFCSLSSSCKEELILAIFFPKCSSSTGHYCWSPYFLTVKDCSISPLLASSISYIKSPPNRYFFPEKKRSNYWARTVRLESCWAYLSILSF